MFRVRVRVRFASLVDLGHYFSPKTNTWKLSLAPGSYRLRADYSGVAIRATEANVDMRGVALFPTWTGTIHSSEVSFAIAH
jgi:hypothetical protein